MNEIILDLWFPPANWRYIIDRGYLFDNWTWEEYRDLFNKQRNKMSQELADEVQNFLMIQSFQHNGVVTR